MLTSFPSLPKQITSRARFLRAAAALSIAVTTVACIEPASADPLSAKPTEVAQAASNDMARCQQLYAAWAKFKATSTNGSGRDIQSQVALQDCKDGRVDVGTAQLENLLQADRIPVPPRQSAAAQ